MNGAFVFLLVSTFVIWKVSGQCSGTAESKTVGYTTVKVSPPGYPSPGYAMYVLFLLNINDIRIKLLKFLC